MSRRRRPSESNRKHSSTAAAATPGSTNPLAEFMDRMFCCSYSGDQIFTEAPEMEYVGDNSLVLDGSVISERALRYFPSIEKAHELRSSSPCKTRAEFIFPEDKLQSPAKKLHLRGDGSTATTESSNSSIHSWNTLPTQSSDESCFSLPDYHVFSSSSTAAPGQPPPPYKYHQRRSTDPDLAETLLLQRIQAEARHQQHHQQLLQQQQQQHYQQPTMQYAAVARA